MKRIKKLCKRIKKLASSPGIFSKALVLFCLGYSVRVIEWAMDQFEQSNTEASTLLTVAIGLFGGELLFLCIKRVFAKVDKKESSGVDEQDSDGVDMM